MYAQTPGCTLACYTTLPHAGIGIGICTRLCIRILDHMAEFTNACARPIHRRPVIDPQSPKYFRESPHCGWNHLTGRSDHPDRTPHCGIAQRQKAQIIKSRQYRKTRQKRQTHPGLNQPQQGGGVAHSQPRRVQDGLKSLIRDLCAQTIDDKSTPCRSAQLRSCQFWLSG